MNPTLASIFWTALVLLWMRQGGVATIIPAIAFFEVFYLLSSLPIEFLQRWPLFRPCSMPMGLLAVALFIITAIYRVSESSKNRIAKPRTSN